jgi:hypothetical protein
LRKLGQAADVAGVMTPPQSTAWLHWLVLVGLAVLGLVIVVEGEAS